VPALSIQSSRMDEAEQAGSPPPDIPHCPSHGHASGGRPSRLQCSSALEQVLVSLRKIHHLRPWPGEQEPMPPRSIMKDPPCGGMLPRVARWIGNRGRLILESPPDAVLQRRRHEPADRQHPQQRHDPLGWLARARRGQAMRLVAAPNAPFRTRLAVIGVEPGLRRQRGRVEGMGGPDAPALLRHHRGQGAGQGGPHGGRLAPGGPGSRRAVGAGSSRPARRWSARLG
jgi:hypothetical protein